MRWLALYARSRQVPAAVAASVAFAVLAWTLTSEPGDPRPAVLVLAATVAATAVGLSGQDVQLDRTAAFRWLPRRAAHAVLIGLFAATVLLALQAMGEEPAFVVRDSAGLMGLAALSATALGGHLAWTLPLGWFAVASFIPPADGVGVEIATWMLAPPGTGVATWTSVVLAVVGTATYAVAGPRR